MPTMFPSLVPPEGDRNRSVEEWKAGDPTPRQVVIAFVLFIIVGCAMVLSAVGMFQLNWNRTAASPQEQERMDFVVRNVRLLGVLLILLGVPIVGLAPGLRKGSNVCRRIILGLSVLAMFFMLGGWVLKIAATGQAVLALLLAVACLLMYRPGLQTFFVRHSLWRDPLDDPPGNQRDR
ncbi:hypothetical protein [Corynebacterium heidelbergense]|uniref:Uncharacterized protein n=1 Tax=Corynebacterium heidelbergense TaxID=2055947 RepID=A0A364V8I4_9CORY|nr:hypothetical protein [Corynebacterium heidelbergense]RAV32928.1 hypothetical protein DLJ54_00940 [Corynebacterium heidelbergense]